MGKVAVSAAVICAAAAVCAAAAAVVVRRRMQRAARWEKAVAIVKDFEEKCGTPTWKLERVADAMTQEMHAGLAACDSQGAPTMLKMLITYVSNLPSGYSFFKKKKKNGYMDLSFFFFWLVFMFHLIHSGLISCGCFLFLSIFMLHVSVVPFFLIELYVGVFLLFGYYMLRERERVRVFHLIQSVLISCGSLLSMFMLHVSFGPFFFFFWVQLYVGVFLLFG